MTISRLRPASAAASALVLFVLPASGSWDRRINELKKTVVNVEVRTEVSLGQDRQGKWSATAFVADSMRGILVTNQHVMGSSPCSSVEVAFFNGEVTRARPLYFDPWMDFAFLKYDPDSIKSRPPSVEFASHGDLRENEELLLISNNERESYTIKRGRLTKLFVNKWPNNRGRYSHHIHTDFDRTGGSSGAPVWNRKGKVVGLHTSGTDTSSFELRIDYVTDALEVLRRGEVPERGDIEVVLGTLEISKAVRYFGLPSARIERARADNKKLRFVLAIEGVLAGSAASQVLEVGDIVMEVAGTTIGEDLYAFDRAVDAHKRRSIALLLWRNGSEIAVEIPVPDAHHGKVSRFVRLAGSTFAPVSTDISLSLGIPREGIFLSESGRGTMFADLGAEPSNREEAYKRKVVVRAVGGVKVRTLDDFIGALSGMSRGDPLVVVYRDLYDFGERTRAVGLDLEASFAPMDVFRWDSDVLEWVPENHPSNVAPL